MNIVVGNIWIDNRKVKYNKIGKNMRILCFENGDHFFNEIAAYTIPVESAGYCT